MTINFVVKIPRLLAAMSFVFILTSSAYAAPDIAIHQRNLASRCYTGSPSGDVDCLNSLFRSIEHHKDYIDKFHSIYSIIRGDFTGDAAPIPADCRAPLRAVHGKPPTKTPAYVASAGICSSAWNGYVSAVDSYVEYTCTIVWQDDEGHMEHIAKVEAAEDKYDACFNQNMHANSALSDFFSYWDIENVKGFIPQYQRANRDFREYNLNVQVREIQEACMLAFQALKQENPSLAEHKESQGVCR